MKNAVAAWLLALVALLLVAPGRAAAVAGRPPAKTAPWGLGAESWGRPDARVPAEQAGIRVGELYGYDFALGRRLFLQPDPRHFEAGDFNLYRYCHNDPVNKTDPMGLAPGDPFDTLDGAAKDAVLFINPTSIRANAEYGGLLYQGTDGKFYATPARTDGSGNSVRLSLPLKKMGVPEDKTERIAGDYHTHGDYSRAQKDYKGRTIMTRVKDKESDNQDSDNFSGSDTTRSDAIFKKDPQYRSYLGTPSGKVYKYNPTKPKAQRKEEI